MTEHSIYSIKTSATPVVMPPPSSTMPDFCPFACDLSKLEPQLAIRIELLTAARMRETARAECSRAGMVPGRLPESKAAMQGKMANAKPRSERDALVLACLSAIPTTAYRIRQITGLNKSVVSNALLSLKVAGKVQSKPGTKSKHAQTEWWLS